MRRRTRRKRERWEEDEEKCRKQCTEGRAVISTFSLQLDSGGFQAGWCQCGAIENGYTTRAERQCTVHLAVAGGPSERPLGPTRYPATPSPPPSPSRPCCVPAPGGSVRCY